MVKTTKMSSGRPGQVHKNEVEAQVPESDAIVTDPLQNQVPMHTVVPEDAAVTHEELRRVRAELKIHKDAWTSEAEKYAALSAKFDREAHDKAAVSANLIHIRKLIRNAELAFYEHSISQASFDADGWREMYQKLLAAVMPVFVNRD